MATWKSDAATGKATSCAATARASANGLCVTRSVEEATAGTVRRVRQAGHAGQLAVPGALPVRMIFRARRLRPSGSWIRGYVHEVVIGCGAGIIARHPRSYDREDMVFDPIHYLPLLEHKIGALDQAAPLAGWELPDAFPTLRRLLEARMGKAGKREYVQAASGDLRSRGASRRGEGRPAPGCDRPRRQTPCAVPYRATPPKLDLDIYYLPRANVATTAAASYMSLLGGGAS